MLQGTRSIWAGIAIRLSKVTTLMLSRSRAILLRLLILSSTVFITANIFAGIVADMIFVCILITNGILVVTTGNV